MKKSKTKIFILFVIALAVCTSVFAGIFFYSICSSILTDHQNFDDLDWAVRLNQYEGIEALDTDRELYMVSTEDDKNYLIDGHGKKVPWELDCKENSDILIAFSQDDKWGYKYPDGKIVIAAKFDEAYDFDDGYAKVSKNGTDYFVIDDKGRTVFEPGERASELEQISGKFFLFYKAKHRSVINVETGQVTEDVGFYDSFHDAGEGMFAAKTDFAWDDVEPMFLLSRSFKPMFSGQLYNQIGSFGQGLCYVQKLVDATEEEHEDYQIENGYMNTDGDIVIKTATAIFGCKFAEGRALLYEGKRICCIDQSGSVLFSLKPAKTLEKKLGEDFEYRYSQCYFRNGKAIVYYGKFYGLIDEDGNWVIQPVFDEMTYAGTDKLLVEYKGMSGMIRLK